MSILSAVAGLVIWLLQVLIEIPMIWIGELVLFLVSFGWHRPRWDLYADTGRGDSALLSEMSFWVGMVALCGIGGGIKLIFFSA